MTHKATWTGPERTIKGLGGKANISIKPGDDFEIPDGQTLGGEDVNFKITGGPAHAAALKAADAADVKGRTKMSRLELAKAVEAAAAAKAEKAKATTEEN